MDKAEFEDDEVQAKLLERLRDFLKSVGRFHYLTIIICLFQIFLLPLLSNKKKKKFMIKMGFDKEAVDMTAEEFLTKQLSKMRDIFYDFEEDGYCWLGLEFREADMATPEEFLPIALERFNKFGIVEYEVIDKDNDYINDIRCIDEKLTKDDYLKMLDKKYEKNED